MSSAKLCISIHVYITARNKRGNTSFHIKIWFNIQVPLGVLLYNENKLDEMGKIMAHYMTLVPTTNAEGHFTLPSGDVMDFDDTRFHKILFGGDQLTVARMRGTQALRDTQDKPVDRLEGVIPVAEDWHTRMTLMKVRHTVAFSKNVTISVFSTSMFRLFGVDCTRRSPQKRKGLCTSYETLLGGQVYQLVQTRT